MSIHYYSGFFEADLPTKMAELLRIDIINKKSIVVIAGFGNWLPNKDPKVDLSFAKDEWLDPAGIAFDEYHLINSSTPKEEAHILLRNASVILLQGGYTTLQNAFLEEYELVTPIKESKADVIIGISAGAKNMATKAVFVESNGNAVDKSGVYDGLGLDNFCYEPYFSPDNEELVRQGLLPMSQKLDVYATINGSFMRVKDGEILTFGDTYLISGSEINKA